LRKLLPGKQTRQPKYQLGVQRIAFSFLDKSFLVIATVHTSTNPTTV
jgi:hypothetical protein